MNCITQWWFQLMKGNAGFSLWALNGVLLEGGAHEPELCHLGKTEDARGETVGFEINLLRLFFEREEENPYNSQHNVAYLFQYLQAAPSRALPFIALHFVFSSIQPSPWKANRSEHKPGSLSSTRDSAFTSPVSVTKPAVLASGSVLTSPKEVRVGLRDRVGAFVTITYWSINMIRPSLHVVPTFAPSRDDSPVHS